MRNIKTLLFVLIFMLLFVFESHCQTNQIFAPSFKKSNLNGNNIEHLDSISMIYSNFKYGFSMDFPDNWKFDRGNAEHTVIRAGQKDSFMLAAVNVIELKEVPKSDFSLWKIWDNKELGMAEFMKNELKKALNSEIIDYSWRKVYVNNREAIETKLTYILKELDYEFDMKYIAYSISNKNQFSYTVAIKTPKYFYEVNPSRFDYMINNFVFLAKIDDKLIKPTTKPKYKFNNKTRLKNGNIVCILVGGLVIKNKVLYTIQIQDKKGKEIKTILNVSEDDMIKVYGFKPL